MWDDKNNVRRQERCGKTRTLWEDKDNVGRQEHCEKTRTLCEDKNIKPILQAHYITLSNVNIK